MGGQLDCELTVEEAQERLEDYIFLAESGANVIIVGEDDRCVRLVVCELTTGIGTDLII